MPVLQFIEGWKASVRVGRQSVKPEHYQKLADAKLTVEQIGVVMRIMAEAEDAIKAAEEARKSVARDRVQRWREKKKADVTLPKHNGNATVRLTRGEDSSSNQEITGKEEKKVASPSARPSRGSRIPDDFCPDIEAAVAEGVPRLEAERQARSFCDYWRSKPGSGGLKLDWPATWRVWYRRNIPTVSKPQATAPPPAQDFNAILDAIQGKPHVPQHSGPAFDGSYERTDRGSAPNLVQLHAVSSGR